MMDKMLPCPFCGSDAELVTFDHEESGELVAGHSFRYSNTTTYQTPKCVACDCKLDNGWLQEKDAIKAWNTRKEPA